MTKRTLEEEQAVENSPARTHLFRTLDQFIVDLGVIKDEGYLGDPDLPRSSLANRQSCRGQC